MNKTLFAALLILGGCSISGAGLEGEAAAARIVKSSLQCGSLPRQQSVTWIPGRQQLEQALILMQGALVPAQPPAVPDIDLQRWNLLLISAGQKPSAGYYLTLDQPAFSIGKTNARLNVVLNRPAPDSMVASVITHPCILVKIPAGGYSAIEIHGLDRLETISVAKPPLQQAD